MLFNNKKREERILKLERTFAALQREFENEILLLRKEITNLKEENLELKSYSSINWVSELKEYKYQSDQINTLNYEIVNIWLKLFESIDFQLPANIIEKYPFYVEEWENEELNGLDIGGRILDECGLVEDTNYELPLLNLGDFKYLYDFYEAMINRVFKMINKDFHVTNYSESIDEESNIITTKFSFQNQNYSVESEFGKYLDNNFISKLCQIAFMHVDKKTNGRQFYWMETKNCFFISFLNIFQYYVLKNLNFNPILSDVRWSQAYLKKLSQRHASMMKKPNITDTL